MNQAQIFSLVFNLALPTVLGFEKIFGEAKKGVDKKALVKESVTDASVIALKNLTGDNTQYAAIATEVAGEAIDAAVITTRANGTYQAATAKAKALAIAPAQSQTGQTAAA